MPTLIPGVPKRATKLVRGTLSRKSWFSTLQSTPTKVRLARLVAFDWETLELYRHCLGAEDRS